MFSVYALTRFQNLLKHINQTVNQKSTINNQACNQSSNQSIPWKLSIPGPNPVYRYPSVNQTINKSSNKSIYKILTNFQKCYLNLITNIHQSKLNLNFMFQMLNFYKF